MKIFDAVVAFLGGKQKELPQEKNSTKDESSLDYFSSSSGRTCSHCGGSGVLMATVAPHELGYEEEICAWCKGSGAT